MAKRNAVQKIGKHIVTFADDPQRGLPKRGPVAGDDTPKSFNFLTGRPATGPPLWTVQEVAAFLRCSVSSLNKWRLSGLGPRFVRVGSRVRYCPADVLAYVAQQTCASTSSEVRAAELTANT